jgi:hypothetical protein
MYVLTIRNSYGQFRFQYHNMYEAQGESMVYLLSARCMIMHCPRCLQTKFDCFHVCRVTMSTLEDFDSRMSQQIERNALLESELDEKGKMDIMCQRLKDEVRDLRSEIKSKRGPQGDGLQGSPSQSHPSPKPGSGVNPPSTPSVTASMSTPIGKPTTVTPSTRINALNMVGDLLRKVGALESRLASCRSNIVTRDSNKSFDTPVQRHKRIQGSRFNGDVNTSGTGNVATITV